MPDGVQDLHLDHEGFEDTLEADPGLVLQVVNLREIARELEGVEPNGGPRRRNIDEEGWILKAPSIRNSGCRSMGFLPLPVRGETNRCIIIISSAPLLGPLQA